MMPQKPAAILDRDREWSDLTEAWEDPGPQLIIATGRRRVGKSFLLKHFTESVRGMYYQATKRTESDQLGRLSAMVGERLGGLASALSFRDWESFLDYITIQAKDEKYLLVLDEFTYLSEASSALPSILQYYWDHRWPDTRLKLVLSGSHITAMQQLEGADQPLYGRRTGRLEIHPFDYADAGQFLTRYEPRDRMKAFGIFGGLPGHLTFVNQAISLEQNVMKHMLEPTGRLLDDAQHMLDAFLSDARDHYSIIEAVANGESTYGKITSSTGLAGGQTHRAFQWLHAMRLVERYVPITEKPRSKRSLYRINDPYVAFWHRFIAPLINSGSIGIVHPRQLWEEGIAPRLDDYMGLIFEAACRAFVRRGKGLPFMPARVGTWWDSSSENEIDVVAIGAREQVLVAECKWGRLHRTDLHVLRERSELLLKARGMRAATLHLALFAGGPIDRELQADAKEGQVLIFDLESLYSPDGMNATARA